MGPWRFSEKAGKELAGMRLFPPLVGQLYDLRIAATLVSDTDHQVRGVFLLANCGYDNVRCLRVAGDVGAYAIGQAGVGPGADKWSAEVAVAQRDLASLVCHDTVEALESDGSAALSGQDELVVVLTVRDPGGRDHQPTINGLPLQDITYA